MKTPTGLNLPIVRKKDAIGKLSSPRGVENINLSKKSAVDSALKTNSASVQKEVFTSVKGLDLVLVGDLTGSMASYHALLKEKFVFLCNELFSLIPNLRIGIVFYLDHGSGDPYETSVQELTVNRQELVNFIQATVTGCGGDADEAVEDALHVLESRMNWKESNSRSVVIFGDASPHPANQCPYHYDYFDITCQLVQKNVTINSVYCENSLGQEQLQKLEDVGVGDFSHKHSYLCAPNFFSWIANVTGGMIIGVDRIEDLLDIIMASAAKDSGHLDDLEKKIKITNPNKLKLIEVARKASIRKSLKNGEGLKRLN